MLSFSCFGGPRRSLKVCGSKAGRRTGEDGFTGILREDDKQAWMVSIGDLELCDVGSVSVGAKSKTVYFFRRFDGLIKIGYSADFAGRFRSVRSLVRQLCEGRDEMSILALVNGGSRVERFLHVAFREYWAGGEWFFPGGRIMGLIEAINIEVSQTSLYYRKKYSHLLTGKYWGNREPTEEDQRDADDFMAGMDHVESDPAARDGKPCSRCGLTLRRSEHFFTDGAWFPLCRCGRLGRGQRANYVLRSRTLD